MEKLHVGARWLFRFRSYFVLIFVGLFLIPFFVQFFMVGSMISGGSENISALFVSFIISFFMGLIFIFVAGEIYARLSYNNWAYEFTPTNLKVERGIIWKRYSNVPYERVQNVDIHRGILARMNGFSSVLIQTAGMSYSPRGGGIGAEGYLPAVTPHKAEEIREFLMKKISKTHGQGM
ncbi:MAG: PH domain-containing protein [Nanoarchaeota archaeon]|nr:PH domain-containing protein [Nanoarchaeota archaeon]